MAEAHNSARVASTDEIRHLKRLLKNDEEFGRSKLKLRLYQTRVYVQRQVYNWHVDLHNAVFPQHWLSYVVSLTGPPMLMRNETSSATMGTVRDAMWRFARAIPIGSFIGGFSPRFERNVRMSLTTLIAGTSIFMGLVYARRYAIRALLGYTKWIYEGRKKSWKTKIWGFAIKMLLGNGALMNSYSTSLPRLPVPLLEDTIKRYLESVEGPLDDNRRTEMKALAKDFLHNEGPNLQRFLRAKSWLSENYVTDWWEKYVYLMSRDSLMINSNYYVCDLAYITPSNDQVARAAVLMYGAVRFKELLDRETLEPIVMGGVVPVCMKQYERLFSTTRIPGEDLDEIKHFTPIESKHCVVFVNGSYFALYLYTRFGTPLHAFEIEIQLRKIIEDSKLLQPSSHESRIPALTGWERNKWAKVRSTFFKYGVNKQSLDMIESAMFFCVLDSDAPANLNEMGKLGLHGKGHNRWFDKSFTLMVYSNGKAGLNCEHAWADAPIVGHMWEYMLFVENLEGWYNSSGQCVVPMKTSARQLSRPPALAWSITALPLREAIDEATAVTTAECEDLQLHLSRFDTFGKMEIKKIKVSPDGFVQQALQLAFHRTHGFIPQTYESSMTRLYQAGRTETVRSATPESSAFVMAMLNDASKDEKTTLLRAACEKHQQISREAMTGQGCDRHMFALYIASKGMGVESKFLEEALGAPWTLSTSQQPQSQTNLWDKSMTLAYFAPGGGFGPVSDKGYGVSYMVLDEYIFFHVTSKKSSGNTDSKEFSAHIHQALQDVIDVALP